MLSQKYSVLNKDITWLLGKIQDACENYIRNIIRWRDIVNKEEKKGKAHRSQWNCQTPHLDNSSEWQTYTGTATVLYRKVRQYIV